MLHSVSAAFSLLVLVVLAVLPWGFGEAGRLAVALLPGIGIYFWVGRREGVVPVSVVFGCGFACDILGGGVLGTWVLVYLGGYLGAVVSCRFAGPGLLGRAAGLGGSVLLMVAVLWGLSRVASGVWVPLRPLLVAGIWVILAYPFVAGVLAMVAGRERGDEGFGPV